MGFLGLVFLFGCATGSHVLTGKPHPSTIPDLVQVYSNMPEKCEQIGDLSAYDTAPFGTFQKATDRCMKHLKSDAAKMGANGIVIKTHYAGIGGVNFSATAIFIP